MKGIGQSEAFFEEIRIFIIFKNQVIFNDTLK